MGHAATAVAEKPVVKTVEGENQGTANAGQPNGRAANLGKRLPRLALIDGLRFVAAITVLLYHYTAWHHGFWGTAEARESWPTLSKFSVFGNMGVQLFFIISGFVILLSSYGKNPSKFVGSRIARLYPAYWIAVLASGFLVIKLWPQMGEGRNFADLLANLTMFHPAMGVRHIDGVYWTLWVEMRFYILILLLMLLRLLTLRGITALAVVWPLVGLWDQLANNSALSNTLMSQYAPLFAGGMMLFMIYKFGSSLLRWSILVMNVALSAYFTGITAPGEAEELAGYIIQPWVYWLIIVGIFGLVALLSLSPLRNIQWKFLAMAGALTYPVYLLHQVWGWWLIDKLQPVVSASPAGKYLVLASVISLVVGAAYLVHRFIERPLAKPMAQNITRGLDYVGKQGGKTLKRLLPSR